MRWIGIMETCNKCSEYGLPQFEEQYKPVDFIEGKRDSLIWIVGLNPKDDGTGLKRSLKELEEWPKNHKNLHSYFKDFQKVSNALFNDFGKSCGTAHTDIVKCASKTFPLGKTRRYIIENCKPYLMQQIDKHRPRLIVCNGSEVSKFMKEFISPPQGFKLTDTSYWSDLNGTKICVILSGYIGRIDDHSKRRLGKEIESRWREVEVIQ
jgi:hypothetical protein